MPAFKMNSINCRKESIENRKNLKEYRGNPKPNLQNSQADCYQKTIHP